MGSWERSRYGKDESRELNCGSTSSIYQDILNGDNLLHKLGFVDSLTHIAVSKDTQSPLSAVRGARTADRGL